MTMFALTSFGISIAGIVVLLSLKHWGIGEKGGVYQSVRMHLDKKVERFTSVLKRVPNQIRALFLGLFHLVAYRISSLFLKVVRFLERRLLKFINMIKGKGEVNRKKGSVSVFLTAIKDENNSSSPPQE